MKRWGKKILLLAVLATAASMAVWAFTDRHPFTKYSVVEEVEVPLDDSDPLAGTGLFDGDMKTESVKRSEFHLGLLPTPSGIIDKHAVSVASISGPPWALALGLLWLGRRRARRTEADS